MTVKSLGMIWGVRLRTDSKQGSQRTESTTLCKSVRCAHEATIRETTLPPTGDDAAGYVAGPFCLVLNCHRRKWKVETNVQKVFAKGTQSQSRVNLCTELTGETN